MIIDDRRQPVSCKVLSTWRRYVVRRPSDWIFTTTTVDWFPPYYGHLCLLLVSWVLLVVYCTRAQWMSVLPHATGGVGGGVVVTVLIKYRIPVPYEISKERSIITTLRKWHNMSPRRREKEERKYKKKNANFFRFQAEGKRGMYVWFPCAAWMALFRYIVYRIYSFCSNFHP